jgi:hypothetical protein
MNLTTFIEKSVNTLGGLYEPLSYMLSYVILPDEYAGRFQNKTEFTLAFDFDVAQENPGCEFVTYGSFILETFLEIIRDTPEITHKYVFVPRIELANADSKIQNALDLHTVPKITDETLGVVMFVRFNFAIKFISDETNETFISVWVNLLNGKVDEEIASYTLTTDSDFDENQNLLSFESIGIAKAYQAALEHANNLAKQNSILETSKALVQSETTRIATYYDELIIENYKRKTRRGVTQARLKEIDEKEAALKIEKARQISEIIEKYTARTEPKLENAIVYHFPFIRFECSIKSSGKVSQFGVYYNFATKKFQEL